MDVKRETIIAEERTANARIAAEEWMADRQLEQGERIGGVFYVIFEKLITFWPGGD